MKRLGLLITLLVFVLAGVGVVAAQDRPCGPCPVGAQCLLPECDIIIPGVFTNPAWLRVNHHRVSVDIENQVATTNVDLEFENEGDGLAEGTFLFPLPSEASVDELIMYIDGVAIESKILPADEARAIYDAIVRQHRDPALLEYVGRQTIQANVFPIPPGESRRITIRYTQVLEVDNGLLHYVYPYDVTSLMSSRRVDSASISVNVSGNDEISSIYSPSHNVAISRQDGDTGFRAGWEASNYAANDDFSLYYGLANDEISLNLLSYRESAREDGFFMLMVQPPLELDDDRIQPRDIIIVLDQSGSMSGPKWSQAQQAAAYVLDNLNSRDRFNVVLFSTGWRLFSNRFEPRSAADEAIDWIDGMFAEGGTDINGALMTAMGMADRERDTAILFLTDGLATEGVINTPDILDNVKDAAPSNVRLFSFGVGNDVDTFLLDLLAREFGGTSTYVRPNEDIAEEVASLYNKIGAPVLTDVTLDFGDLRIDTIYPGQPLPDLFAGTQLTIVGRYRDGMDNAEIVLSGRVNGERISYVYDGLEFRERAGGEPFVARLWATRRIGDLLNNIRLNGENAELVDSIVNLSVRYGIITPYTSFLIEEDDILTQTGREQAQMQLGEAARNLSATASGAAAVDAADQFGGFAAAEAPAPQMAPMPTGAVGGGDMGIEESEADGTFYNEAQNPIQTIGVKTFIMQNGVWTDTTFEPDTMTTEKITFLSDEYFALLEEMPEIGQYLAIGERVIVVIDGTAYEVVAEE